MRNQRWCQWTRSSHCMWSALWAGSFYLWFPFRIPYAFQQGDYHGNQWILQKRRHVTLSLAGRNQLSFRQNGSHADQWKTTHVRRGQRIAYHRNRVGWQNWKTQDPMSCCLATGKSWQFSPSFWILFQIQRHIRCLLWLWFWRINLTTYSDVQESRRLARP